MAILINVTFLNLLAHAIGVGQPGNFNQLLVGVSQTWLVSKKKYFQKMHV